MNNNLITGVLAGVSGVLSYIFGPWDAMIMVLIAVVALDYITGVAYAAISRTLSSAIGFKGLLKKVFIFVLVALSTMLDKLVPATNGAVRSAVCMFYIANEGLSILENAGRIGLPMPEALKGAHASNALHPVCFTEHIITSIKEYIKNGGKSTD